ncbi:MAG: hypothetical protein EAZ55_09790 [Cytophagales bacterium]|nr:MAG: hypothetical protein EAZ55_09790 [Cytophagales bacterium]
MQTDDIAQKLLEQFWQRHPKTYVEGKDLTAFSESKQINLFIIKHLYDVWQAESAQLQSPFFDYSAPEVKKALQNLLNLLSQHINIERTDFDRLVLQATSQTLSWLYAPEATLTQWLEKFKLQFIPISIFKEWSKYIVFHKVVYSTFFQKITERHISEIYYEDALQTWQETCQYMPYAFDKPEVVAPWLFSPSSTDATETTMENIEENAPKEDSPSPTLSPSETTPTYTATTEKEKEKEEEAPLTINDLHKHDQKPTLLDKLNSRKISQLRENININQRFLFTQQLFAGDNIALQATLTELDTTIHTWQQAEQYLSTLAKNYQWNWEEKNAQAFLEFVHKRFLD